MSEPSTTIRAGRAGRRRLGPDAVVVLSAVLPRPALWWPALTALARLSRRRWWRQPPYLPVPGEAYWRFRVVTALGGAGDDVLSRNDVVAYLHWCQRTRPRRG